MSSPYVCEVAPEGGGTNQNAKCFTKEIVDGYHLATLRAFRKKSAVISVKLFKLVPKGSVEVGRIIVHHKGDLPEDWVEDPDGNPIIILNARLDDYERMMDLICGECRVGIEFSGESWDKGRAYLKSLCYVFPKRTK